LDLNAWLNSLAATALVATFGRQALSACK
jgi:hypothetical protein